MSNQIKPQYWNGNGKHEALYKQLLALIPSQGECADAKGANKNLDRLRRAANCYYDVFNNGLCNRAKEAREIFGFGAPRKGSRVDFNHPDILKYDAAMDGFIEAAYAEQFTAQPEYSI
jgi:hypothetical protein